MSIEEWLPVIGTLLGGLGAAAAAVVAVGALRANKRASVADQLMIALGELHASLASLSDQSLLLSSQGAEGEAKSRAVLGDEFRRFAVANTKISLLEPILAPKFQEYGGWVRNVANNLASNLLQADEFAQSARHRVSAEAYRVKPSWASGSDWVHLRRSTSFLSAQDVMADLPLPSSVRGVQSLDRWWGDRVTEFGRDGGRSVYDPEALYLVQHARLLDDFVADYLMPWARSFLGRGLLGVRRTKQHDSPRLISCVEAPDPAR
jgi:hypothetical protein